MAAAKEIKRDSSSEENETSQGHSEDADTVDNQEFDPTNKQKDEIDFMNDEASVTSPRDRKSPTRRQNSDSEEEENKHVSAKKTKKPKITVSNDSAVMSYRSSIKSTVSRKRQTIEEYISQLFGN